MQTIYTIATLLIIIGPLSAQEIFNPAIYEFACEGEVILSAKYDTIYVYDGNDSQINTYTHTIKSPTGKKIWEKKKADRNCLSSNPDDCLVWCLVEEIKEEKFEILEDTSATAEWHRELIEIQQSISTGNLPNICKNKVSKELLSALRNRLYNLGYNVNSNKNYKRLKGKLLKALKQFQIDNNLPVGKLTRQTMEHLYNF